MWGIMFSQLFDFMPIFSALIFLLPMKLVLCFKCMQNATEGFFYVVTHVGMKIHFTVL